MMHHCFRTRKIVSLRMVHGVLILAVMITYRQFTLDGNIEVEKPSVPLDRNILPYFRSLMGNGYIIYEVQGRNIDIYQPPAGELQGAKEWVLDVVRRRPKLLVMHRSDPCAEAIQIHKS